MADLGTLWFGADIDLTALKQKIEQGNKDALNALKISYDPQSYQQMVSKLKNELSKETFEIKVSTNIESARQSVENTLRQVGQAGTVGGNLSGLSGIKGMTKDILDQREAIRDNKAEVQALKEVWELTAKKYGENSLQAKSALKEYNRAKYDLRTSRYELEGMNIARGKAALAQSELNKQQREAAKAARQMTSDHLRLNATLAGGVHVSTQLGSALSSLFAVDAARQFLGNVIEIGGQLEKQRISIGAILGDTVKASHLFEQIKGLAIKSPFGVLELDQYTKQLSAYGFQYNELFDMTKRLADISAGAGTDIGRLTLALGHVRSATYLTGITLRQFSMNNIPMIKMLADYYTELEGKIVSTAEVQKRISKRQVSYEDVIEQIRRLTNEGGMFYNMQEKISESLAAKFKNLKDAMDIMYGEMAESSVGDMLKSLAGTLLGVTRHWKEIAKVMAVAGGAFLIGKTRIGLATIELQGNTAATLRNVMTDKRLIANKLRAAQVYRTLTAEERIQIASSNSLTAADLRQAMAMETLTKEDVLRIVALKKLKIAQAMHLVGINGITAAEIRAAAAAGKWKTALAGLQMSLKNAFMGIGPGTWATLAIMAGTAIYSSIQNFNERIDDKAKEMKDIVKSRINDVEKLKRTLDKEGSPKNNAETKARVDEMKQVLANSEAYTKTLDEQLKKTSDINEQYKILSKALNDVLEKNQKAIDMQDTAAKMIKASVFGNNPNNSFTSEWIMGGKSTLGAYMFNDSINKNIDQVLESYKDLRIVIDSLWEYKDAIKEVIQELMDSGKISQGLADRLKDAPFEEQLRLLAESGYWEEIVSKVEENKKGFVNYADVVKKAMDKVNSRWEEIAKDDVPRMVEALKTTLNKNEEELREWALNNIEDFKMMLEKIEDQLDIKEPSIRKRLKRLFLDYVRFSKVLDNTVTPEQYAQAEQDILKTLKATDDTFKKFYEEDELATLTDDAGPKDSGGNKGKKEDRVLKKWQERYDALKTYYDEVQKFVKLGYSVSAAMKEVERLGLAPSGIFGNKEATRDNYAHALKNLLAETAGDTEERRKLQQNIKSALGDFERNGVEEQMKKNVSIMSDYIKKMDSQWKLYRDVLKKTGDKGFASLAFNEGVMWDEVSRAMLQEFNAKGAEKGVIPINFSWDLNEEGMKEALRDANGVVQPELVDLAKKIQDIIRSNYQNFIKDSADAYSKALSEQDKLNALIREKNQLEDEARRDNLEDEAIRKGRQAQIDALNRQIADQQWAAFKEGNDWGRIFGNLDKMSTSTLQTMLDKLHEVAPTINDSVESTKALYEAIEKIEEVMSNRNPFAAMAESLRMAAVYRNALTYAKSTFGNVGGNDTIGFDAATAKKLGLGNGTKGWTGTLNQLLDGLKGAEEDFTNSVRGIADKFKAIQEVLSPVIDLFEALGNTDISDFFNIGNNALSSAINASSGIQSLAGLFNSESGIGKALGAAGPYAAAAGAALSVATSLVQMHDKTLQKEIEASQARQKEMENLSKNLEKTLERSITGIFELTVSDKELKKLRSGVSSNSIFGELNGGYKSYISNDTKKAVADAEKSKSYYDATYASLLAQRDELQHQYALEEDKKKSDSDKIADYEQQLAEMEDQIKYFAQDMANALYGIDFKSWAEDLAETLVDAWSSGEDAAEAYSKKVSEILKNLGVKMIAERFVSKALQPIMDDFLEQYEKDDGVLTKQGMTILSRMYDAGDTLQKQVNAFMEGLEETAQQRGGSLKETAESSSSTSAGIKSITEETADLLASYINAIRADVSVNRAMVMEYYPQFLEALSRNTLTETQERNLANIALYTERSAMASEEIASMLKWATIDKSRGIYVK